MSRSSTFPLSPAVPSARCNHRWSWAPALCVVLALSGCGGQAAKGGPAGKDGAGKAAGKGVEPVAVSVLAAREAPLERSVTVTGTLAAEDQVAMGFKVAGRIERINVDLGSRVAPGQTIASLAPVDFQLRVQQAEAGLQQARARLGLDPKGSSEAGGSRQDGGGAPGPGGAG